MPAVLAFVAAWPSICSAVQELGLDLGFGSVLHAAEDIRLERPLRVGERLRVRTRALAIHPGSLLPRLWLGSEIHDEHGRMVSEVHTVLAILGDAPAPFGVLPAPEARPKIARERQVVEIAIAEDQAVRYAAASGDDNPIHVEADTSQGRDGPILHGACTQALAVNAILTTLEAPLALVRRVVADFSAPVPPGCTLRVTFGLDAAQGGARRVSFSASVAGRRVLRRGAIWLAEPGGQSHY